MNIDRHIQSYRTLEYRTKSLVIHETSVGKTHDHGALEAKFAHAALQLIGRRFRVRSRQGGEPGEAVGMRADGFIQNVVGGARQFDGNFRIEILRSRIVFGDHLEVDARFVHLAYAQLAEIIEPTLNRCVLFASQRAQFWRRKMFLDGDDFTILHDAEFFRSQAVAVTLSAVTLLAAPAL